MVHTQWSIFNLRTNEVFASVVASWLKSLAGVILSKRKKKKQIEEVRTLNPDWGRTVVLSHVRKTKKQ